MHQEQLKDNFDFITRRAKALVAAQGAFLVHVLDGEEKNKLCEAKDNNMAHCHRYDFKNQEKMFKVRYKVDCTSLGRIVNEEALKNKGTSRKDPYRTLIVN